MCVLCIQYILFICLLEVFVICALLHIHITIYFKILLLYVDYIAM